MQDDEDEEETTDFAGMIFEHGSDIFQEKEDYSLKDTTLIFKMYHFQVLKL